MPYPQIVDYNEAVQNPRTAFRDPELQSGQIKENNLGLPLALSGGFALTYTLMSSSGKKLAIRCFHRQTPSAEARYAAITKCLKAAPNGYFVDFAFQPQGIHVKQNLYPIVRMDWVEGDTLGEFIERYARDASAINRLRENFRQLSAYLEKAGIAHGDIQNGNVMASTGKLRLIDYDGMYVPGMALGQGTEIGHKHFQHPKRTEKTFGPTIDRFSFICIDLSLHALTVDATLHDKFKEGGETIIFKANDFASPHRSAVFGRLFASQPVKQHAEWFAAICRSDVAAIPSLEDFLTGKSIPKGAIVVAPDETEEKPRYIPAHTVLDSSDFNGACRLVGQVVELVGCVQGVKGGATQRGKRRGSPYVFINFGPWQGNIVKITIWSEGLGTLTHVPDSSWQGRWISVVGLVDPPYTSRKYGYTHIGITITAQSQLHQISRDEALFRLGSGNGEVREQGRDNADVLDAIRRGDTRQRPSRTVVSPPAVHRTRNEAVLAQIQGSRGAVPSTTGRTQTGSTRPTQSGSKCFVATAVFQDEDSLFVGYLRQYRDEVLSRHAWGRLVIWAYRQLGPILADVVNWCPRSRRLLKPLLERVAVRLHEKWRGLSGGGEP